MSEKSLYRIFYKDETFLMAITHALLTDTRVMDRIKMHQHIVALYNRTPRRAPWPGNQ